MEGRDRGAERLGAHPGGSASQRGIKLGSTGTEVVAAYGDLLVPNGDAYNIGLDHAGGRIELAGD